VLSVLTVLAISHMWSRIAGLERQLSTDDMSSCVVRLVSGMLMSLRRLDALKNASADFEMIDRLNCCEKLLRDACHQLLTSTLTDVQSLQLLNTDHVLSNLLET